MKVAEREQTKQSAHLAEERQRYQARLEQLDAELTEKRKQLQNTPSDKEIRKQHREATARKAQIANQLRQLEAQEVILVKALDEATYAYNSDRRELLRFQEGEEAHAVFRALEPEMCPRCEGHIGEDRRQREKETHGCSVCGEQIHMKADDSEALRQLLKERVDASRKTHEQSESALQKLKKHQAELEAEESAIDQKCDQLGQSLAGGFDKYYDLQAEIRILEKERVSLTPPLTGSVQTPPSDLEILKAVVKETESQVEDLKNELLHEASQEIVRLAQEFGITAITSATLRGNASLEVIINGTRDTYSKLTGGEQLRLKVATVLAMLNVAEKKGVGRHPGLLFIDSPQNHQVVDEDFRNLLSGLRSAVETLSHLQVFVASTSSEILRQWVGQEHNRIRHAVGEEYLW
ncbi:MAG: hypothetical protein HQL55_13000 [Magnetococcales bacterium]|nr:hypothetical protein [Magnetococcales bacterium]